MDDLDLGQTVRGFTAGQKVFERYTLKRMLGRGGMGIVWLAQDGELDQEVALKFLPEAVMGDRSAIDDMRRETRRARELTHPQIVRIHDFLRDSRMAAISMEYVAGDSLSNRRIDQPLKIFEAADLHKWVEQLCTALEYAHSQARVVHRDLKPANLMLDAHGDLKVTDFGISAMLVDTTTRVSKQAGSSGTPVYMSPQQMMGEKPAVTDDIYSLGATLYELLTGKPPFYTGNILIQVQGKTPPCVMERRREFGLENTAPIPPEWEETIAACLAKDTAQRPQSAAEVWARLNGNPIPAPSVSSDQIEAPVAPVEEPVSAPVRSNSGKRIAAVVVAALVLVGGGALWYFGVREPARLREAEQARLEAVAKEERMQAERLARAKAERERDEAAAAALEAKARAQAAQEKAARELAEAQRKIAAEAARRAEQADARGSLIVRTVPEGADVQVGAVASGKAPLSLKRIPAGQHLLRIRRAGYEDWEGNINVPVGDFEERTVKLVRSEGSVELTSTPSNLEAEIRCARTEGDEPGPNARVVRTPIKLNLPTGDYVVTFRREGWVDQAQSLTVARSANLSVAGDFGPNAARVPVAAAPVPVVKAPPPKVGVVWKIPGLDLEMVPIAPGEFDMGTRRSVVTSVASVGVFRNRTHMKVRLTRPYWIGRCEVTQGQWEAVMGNNPSRFRNMGANAPVENVSYTDALSFCEKLTERERQAGRLPDGYVYTLPTEAQWEYASRAGGDGEDEGKMELNGWYDDNSDKSTHPVGQRLANGWGLCDMRGNVWEWCRDWADHFPGSQATDPEGPASGRNKIARGGAWNRDDGYCTSCTRGQFTPAKTGPDIGFRLVLVSGRSR